MYQTLFHLLQEKYTKLYKKVCLVQNKSLLIMLIQTMLHFTNFVKYLLIELLNYQRIVSITKYSLIYVGFLILTQWPTYLLAYTVQVEQGKLFFMINYVFLCKLSLTAEQLHFVILDGIICSVLLISVLKWFYQIFLKLFVNKFLNDKEIKISAG